VFGLLHESLSGTAFSEDRGSYVLWKADINDNCGPVDLILCSDRDNPLFRSPVEKDREIPLQILDIGTSKGTWALYVGPCRRGHASIWY
jgi:hypothetical protein